MSQQRIAFVGGGNMATSLIGGLLARGTAAADIVVADPDAGQRERLARQFGVSTVSAATAAVDGAGTVVLAVKPQQMAEVSRSVAAQLQASGALVISIAAGIRLADLARWLGPGVPLIRTMPNRPALIGAGITALYAGPDVSTAARQIAEAILAACGPTVWVPDESQIDVVTAVSGSGPAYFFLLIECLEASAIELGLDPVTARKLAVETARGAGLMAAAATETPAELRQQVTSKGGTTAAALEVLEAAGVRGIFAAAVAAGARRSTALAAEFGTL
ncbi:MAG: pyrroline-5-carboxylate reductase [Gammaproteobacteria bacterium]|nr:pyrroline-5-carboxylate reductase [Gammaproteobacteria bacterium]MDH5227858.1 pyrroline-5-carboxylate reductase [Gammaproteobacteria bacterium]